MVLVRVNSTALIDALVNRNLSIKAAAEKVGVRPQTMASFLENNNPRVQIQTAGALKKEFGAEVIFYPAYD